MKVVILAGGFGTRLQEYTNVIPKPMVTIGDKPIIWHIMNHYSSYGYTDFICALGYKSHIVKDFFLNYKYLNSNFSVNLASGIYEPLNHKSLDWNVSLIDTGDTSMTGGRLKRLQPFLNDSTFMLTYGDGLSNIDIDRLLDFHRSHGKMVTVSAVHPSARFGELVLDNELVTSFQEKPQINQGWINGGFFIVEPDFFSFIDDDSTVLEKNPLETVASIGQLAAYKHTDFWQCMDTKRDLDYLESLWQTGNAPWSH